MIRLLKYTHTNNVEFIEEYDDWLWFIDFIDQKRGYFIFKYGENISVYYHTKMELDVKVTDEYIKDIIKKDKNNIRLKKLERILEGD